MPKTSIEWCDVSWPVVNGCRRISAGCGAADGGGCYAERLAATRLSKTPKYRGLAIFKKNGPQWTGETRLWEKELAMPLRLRKPARIFVADMGDLFYEGVSNETIGAVFGVMASAPQHTFQVLTKRTQRMVEWFEWLASGGGGSQTIRLALMAGRYLDGSGLNPKARARVNGCDARGNLLPFPLRNVWIGTSVENQETADERIPKLLRVPAAVRFVSYEPALGPVRYRSEWLRGQFDHCPDDSDDPETDNCRGCPAIPNDGKNGGDLCSAKYTPHLDWIICGGESGPRARPFDVQWARDVVEQCKDTKVAVFVKQLGANVRTNGIQMAGDWWPEQGNMDEDGMGLATEKFGAFRKKLRSRKGDDPLEWPPSLRVRQFPDEARP